MCLLRLHTMHPCFQVTLRLHETKNAKNNTIRLRIKADKWKPLIFNTRHIRHVWSSCLFWFKTYDKRLRWNDESKPLLSIPDSLYWPSTVSIVRSHRACCDKDSSFLDTEVGRDRTLSPQDPALLETRFSDHCVSVHSKRSAKSCLPLE